MELGDILFSLANEMFAYVQKNVFMVNCLFKQLCGFSNNERHHQTAFTTDILWIFKEGSLVSLTNTNKPQQYTWGGRFPPGVERVDQTQ